MRKHFLNREEDGINFIIILGTIVLICLYVILKRVY